MGCSIMEHGGATLIFATTSGLADLLALAFGAVSRLYASVGQAGASAFLAVMT